MGVNRKIIDETIGWCGTTAIILAYGLNSFGYISAPSPAYLLLNATGALGIVYISFRKKAYQPGVLNVIWAVIAGVAIVRLMF